MKKLHCRILICSLVACCTLLVGGNCWGNTVIDSLNNELNKPKVSPRKQVELHNQLAKCYSVGKSDSFNFHINLAIDLANEIQDIDGKITAYYILANFNYKRGNIEKGDEYVEKMRILSSETGYEKGMAHVYMSEGEKYLITSEYAAGLESMKKALVYYEKHQDHSSLSRAYNIMGQLYGDTGKYKLSIELYKKSLVHSKKSSHKYAISAIYNNLASVYHVQRKYIQAIEYYKKGLAIAQSIDDGLIIAINHNNIGDIYKEMQDYGAAMDNYKKFYEGIMDKGEGNPYLLYAYYENTGNVYAALGHQDTALIAYRNALSNAKECKNLGGVASSYDFIGKTLRELGRIEEALPEHLKALDIFERIEMPLETARCKVHIAEIYKRLDKKTLALEYALAAHRWTEENPESYDIRHSCAEVLSKVYSALKDYKSAYHYHVEHKMMSDSLTSVYLVRNVEKYRLEEAIQQREEAAASLVQKEIEKQQQTYLFLVSFVGFATVVIMMGIFNIIKARKSTALIRQQNQEISEKHQLLMTQTAELASINKTKDKLFAIIGHDLRGPISGVEQVLTLLTSGQISKEDFMEMSEDLRANTFHVHQLLENLLHWSYTQMNDGTSVQAAAIRVAPLVDDVVATHSELAKKKSISLSYEVPQDLSVFADPDHVHLVLRNLVGNAIKFTEEKGHIRITASAHNEEMIVFAVQDDGVGMTKEQLEAISKGEASASWGTQGERGVGLGLSICMEMVAKNAGRTWVESKINEGSTFYFVLPKVSSLLASERKDNTKNGHSSSAELHHVSNPSA
ncbi:MAG: tetratricopeptide repeat protein [Bacteroidota bacterium]